MANVQVTLPVEHADELLAHLGAPPTLPSQILGSVSGQAPAGPLGSVAAPTPATGNAMQPPRSLLPAAAANSPLGAVLAPGSNDQVGAAPKSSTWKRVLGTIGEVAGDVLAPGIMPFIPGTQQHAMLEESNRERRQAAQDQSALTQAQAGAFPVDAQARLMQAEAEKERAEKTDAQKAAPTKSVPVFDPSTNSAVMATWHADSGQYIGPDGHVITGAQPYAKPSAAPHDPFHEWLEAHPGATYDDFLKAETAARATGNHATGMGLYSAIRMIDDAARYNPQLYQLLPFFLHAAGVNLPSGVDISQTPAGQPRNAEGQPIGTAMPEAPTSATRSRGQQAQDLLQYMPSVRQMISQQDQAGNLGPLLGRWNAAENKFGGGDPRYAGLRAALETLASGVSRAHLNTEAGVREFNDLLDSGKMTAANLNAALDPIQRLLETYVNTGSGNQPKGGKQKESKWSPPEGAPPAQGVPDGQVLYMDGKPVARAAGGKWVKP